MLTTYLEIVAVVATGIVTLQIWVYWPKLRKQPSASAWEGATETSPLPKAETAAAGEDPLLVKQIEIHHDVTAEAAEEERRRVEIAEIEITVGAEVDEAFAPIQSAAAGDGWDQARTIMRRWGYDLDQMTLDAHHRAANAEDAAREVVTEDIYATQELDVDELNRLLLAGAVLVS